MPSITKRHDSVLQRLTNAIKRGTHTVDKVVPGAPGNNRPDLVITDNNKATIIDVTCPFENDDSALSLAATRKKEKEIIGIPIKILLLPASSFRDRELL
jgi:hypothetical protein